MSIKIYNTISHQKEDFVPAKQGAVGIYCCGPTTYNYIHLGNARPLVVFDTVRRYFDYRGYETNYVQNFTDIDDKIINRAAEEGESPQALAEKYIKAYFEDAAALNVLPADTAPKVTEHIEEIIAMVSGIIERGFAYESEGDVYFDVRAFEPYGQLSGRALDDLFSGARVELSQQKRDPLDFALWKAAKSGEPAWDSPWGQGRPGWHIECSAMSCKYLGNDFDIHGGGADLIFPHHENERAQAQAANGGSFARYWMHNGFITVNKEKMSKSEGNFFLLRDILQKFSGDVIRFYLLSTHYRSPIDFDDEKLSMAQRSLERIHTSYRLLQEALGKASGDGESPLDKLIKDSREQFIEAMDDDFNTALAVSVVFDFCHALNTALSEAPSEKTLKSAVQLFDEWHGVLGMIVPKEKAVAGREEALLQLIIKIRQSARETKNWAAADAIRDGLKEIGIVLEDSPDGVRWKNI